jgi:hypothetical protein
MEFNMEDNQQRGSMLVQFYSKVKQNKSKSRAEGRAVFEEVPYIRKRTPGDKFQEIDRPVRDTDKGEFPNAWAAFQNGREQQEEGTMLSAWGAINPARVEEYAFFKVRTVEQLASVSDSNLQNMGPLARRERDKAKEFLEASKSRAPLTQLQAELEEKSKRLEALEAMVAKLSENSAAPQFDPVTGLPTPGSPYAEETPKKKRVRTKQAPTVTE